MRKLYRLMIFVLIVFVVMLSFTNVKVYGESNDNASSNQRGYYTYDYWGNVMASAPAYTYEREISFSDLGLEKESQFSSIYYANDYIYIIDMGVNTAIIVDYDFNIIAKINSFYNPIKDDIDTFKTPKAITADKDGNIYIADSGNSRVVILKSDYSLKRIIEKPDHLSLEGLTFVPIDIAVSYTGRIYLIGENIYYGIMELDSEGNFIKFVGTNPVKVSLFDTFWRSIMTKEQRDFASLILPQEFKGIDVDSDGFIYATSFTETSPVKRINIDGQDVLVRNWFFEPIGDVDSELLPSQLSAISSNEKGIYAVLDKTYGRVFVYNCDGEMLYMFGGIQREDDYFLQPVDISWLKNDKIAVVDIKKSSVIVFKPTDFGKAVNEASKYHYEGLYEEALEYWTIANKYNTNYDLAFIGIGKSYFYTGDYKKAMEYFKLGNNRTYYSKAFDKNQKEFMKNNFGYFMTGIAVVFASFVGYKIYKKVKNRRTEEDE